MRCYPAVDLWQSVLGELELQVARPAYDTFLKDTQGLSLDGNVLTVIARTPFAAEWLEKRAYQLIKKTAQKVSSRPLDLRFQVDGVHPPRGGNGHRSPPPARLPSLNARYTFASFVTGPSNQMAYSASLAVSEMPGGSYNPLFIYSGVGLGKTHLLHAIGHEVHQRRKRCIYVTSEQFTNDFISSIRMRTTAEFRQKYRSAEVLLIDDIQFIAGKEQTQEVFFHTFNDLHNAARQIVIAADKPPAALPHVKERLCSRFQCGLTVDVQPPGLETRVAILRAKAHATGIGLDDPLVEYLARKVNHNVRELEGALNRLHAYCSFTGSSPTIETAQRALGDLFSAAALPAPTPDRILDLVASHFSMPRAALTGRRRDRETVAARQIAMYLLRHELHLPYSHIGRLLGNRDHSTVTHAVTKIGRTVGMGGPLLQHIITLRDALSTPHTASAGDN